MYNICLFRKSCVKVFAAGEDDEQVGRHVYNKGSSKRAEENNKNDKSVNLLYEISISIYI